MVQDIQKDRMMIRWTYKIREAAVALLQFVAVCSLLSMVCVTTPELQAGEIIGQWVWFGKAALFGWHICIVTSVSIEYYGRDIIINKETREIIWRLIMITGMPVCYIVISS